MRFPSPLSSVHWALLALALGSCSTDSTDNAATGAEKAPVPATTAPAGHPTLIDQKNGFRTHHFGDNLRTFNGLKLNSHQSTAYRKVYETDQQEHIGPTPVFLLRYNFYRDTFYGVDMETTLEVLPALVSLYGPAVQPDPAKSQYWWQGQVATATLQKSGDALPWLSIWHNGLRTQVEAAEKAGKQQAANHAKADL